MKNEKLKEFLKKKVVKFARKAPPIKTPEWLFVISALILSAAWTVLPTAFSRANRVPVLQEIVIAIPHWKLISAYGGYVLAILFSFLAIPPFCRGIQVCYPDEFEAFEHERELHV